MRVTIIAEESRVNVEGFSHSVDLGELMHDGIHVVQWYGDKGEVEYWQGDGPKLPDAIDDFAPYQKFLDAWEVEARKDAA